MSVSIQEETAELKKELLDSARFGMEGSLQSCKQT